MQKTIQTRKRSQPHTFEQRLEEHKERLEIQLARLPEGAERKSVAARIEQLQAAVELNAMLSR